VSSLLSSPREHVGNPRVFRFPLIEPDQIECQESSAMPSLFRFLAAVAIIVGIVYGGMLALAILVQPQSREISVTIPQDRFSKQR
jgi:hypothetical protein